MLPETLDQVDLKVMIPMRAGVDSLNVAAASAVAFWACRPKVSGIGG
jgi:tRNA G18 (ribose-2'-O)-methylase SpoU